MASEQNQVQVHGTFKNKTFARLDLTKIETYSGFFDGGGPAAELENDAKTTFKHTGTPPVGSMVGVAYSGPNADQWVLAWIVPEPIKAPPVGPVMLNKVLGKHVKAGESIDWAVIAKELGDATNEVNTPYVKAKITFSGSKAELFVEFVNLPK